MAGIGCSVPGCEVDAVIVLNNHPVCRMHCEELAGRAQVLDIKIHDVLSSPTKQLAQPPDGSVFGTEQEHPQDSQPLGELFEKPDDQQPPKQEGPNEL